MTSRPTFSKNKKQLLQLLNLKTPKPNPTSFLRHFSAEPSQTEPPPPPPTTVAETETKTNSTNVTQLLSLIQTKDDNWNEEELRPFLSTINPPRLIQVIRRLGDSSKALNFFQWVQTNSPSTTISPSFAYQAIIEIASKEPNSHTKLSNLFQLSKTHSVSLTTDSASILIRSFRKAQMVDESVQVFDEVESSLKNTHLYNTILDVLFCSGRIDDARRVLDEMLQPGSECRPNSLTGSTVFVAILKRNRPGRELRDGEITDLVSRLGENGIFPDSILLTQLITKFCRRRNTNLAWELLHVLMKMEAPVEAPSVNALLTGLGRDRDFKRMNLLMAEMKELGIQPSVVTFGILINYLCKSRRIDEAIQLFKKMTKKEENEGVVVLPDVITFNTLIDGLSKVGRQEEAMELVERMKSQHGCAPNTITYNCLIDGFCKAGDIEIAHKLFEQMEKEGVSPNVVTLNTLVDGMCKHGRTSSALEFFNEMQNKGLKGNAVTYTALITAFCKVNNIEKAMGIFDQMVGARCAPDAKVYYSLINGLAQVGRLDDACGIVSKMKDEGFQLDRLSYNILISGFCKKNRLDKAYEIFKEMINAGIKPDEVTYNTIIARLSESGDFSTAHQVMKNMIDEGCVPTVMTYGALINGFCLADKLDDAMKIFREMGSTSKIPPNTAIYNILIDSLCKEKKIEAALSLMDEMEVKRVIPNVITYNAIFRGLYEKKLLDKALEFMDKMTGQACNPNYVTMEILTDWLPAVGETEKLRSFVQGHAVSMSSM